jgi:hypothetical protein
MQKIKGIFKVRGTERTCNLLHEGANLPVVCMGIKHCILSLSVRTGY